MKYLLVVIDSEGELEITAKYMTVFGLYRILDELRNLQRATEFLDGSNQIDLVLSRSIEEKEESPINEKAP